MNEYFKNIQNCLEQLIDEESIKEANNKVYLNCMEEDVEVAFLTSRHEKTRKLYAENRDKILNTIEKKEVAYIIDMCLDMALMKLYEKKEFHSFIEKDYSDSPYSEYEKIFDIYKDGLEKEKEDVKTFLESSLNESLQEKLEYENRETRKIKKYELKRVISDMLENSINKVREEYELLTKEEERDYSDLNFLDDYRILWLDSIREKANEDVITKSFRGKTFDAIDNYDGKFAYKGLTSALYHISKHNKKKISDKNLWIVCELIRTFEDINIAKALLTKGYKDTPAIMNKKTFEAKIKDDLIQNVLNKSNN